MLKRNSLLVAAIAAGTIGVTALSSEAHANDDALLGAVVGGAIGAIAGASIAASSPYYYDNTYHAAPSTVYASAPVYCNAAPAYYQAAPAYYPHPRVEYTAREEYDHYHAAHYVDHGRRDDNRYGHGNDGHRGH